MARVYRKLNNREKSELMKNNYSNWKKDSLKKGGYFIIFKGFLESDKLKIISGNSLKLYIYLGINSKNMTGEIWHSNESIAKYFKKSERTIRLWMKELEDLKLIKRMQLDFNGPAYTYLQTYENKN